MLNTKHVLKGGLAVVAVLASLATPQAANAQHHSRGYRTYVAPTYVEYQPARYAPVYTNRPVVYTAPVHTVPAPEVVRYVREPVRTRTVYVQPRRDYYPRTVVYRSGRGHGYDRGYGYRGSHRGLRFFRRGRRHRSREFRLDLGPLHIGARSGRHGGVAISVGH
jgi:hypothetical protein